MMSQKPSKVPAGWLIEQWFKEKRFGTPESIKTTLVLVNYGNATGQGNSKCFKIFKKRF
jgi:UDP-N-acetylenolpyruvoylglucosamine reductase